MRTLILTLGVVFGLFFVPAVSFDGTSTALAFTSASTGATVESPQEVPKEAPKAQIDIDINKGGGGRAWYANPMWIAIGGIALVVLILLVVTASRGGGGGTTIVRG